MRLFCAKYVAPMTPERPGEVLKDAAVLVDDRVVLAVGSAATLRARTSTADVIDFGDALLLPGLINAHTHLELSDARPGRRPESFGAWLSDVIRARSSLGGQVDTAAGEAARRGAIESLSFGVTCVGDISRFAGATRGVLAESPLRIVSFGEIQAMAGRRHLLDERLAAATDLRWDGWADRNRLQVAVSPHAPYTVEPAGYRKCLDWAKQHRRPLCTHLAETTEEAVFLADHAGPLREVWEHLRDWDEAVPKHAGGPIRMAAELGLLDADVPVLLAHVNYATDEELTLLARGTASIAYCPRTHAFFGHEPHRIGEMLDRGINVCLGTDSRASSPDLNLVDDLRLVREQLPERSAAALWSLVTWRPARALGIAADVGSLSPGRQADFAVFPAKGDTPLDDVLTEPVRPLATIIAGEAIR